jgi:CDP-diacylglycerol--glycerol-3-phosphate 3-phosphatidyltransferase
MNLPNVITLSRIPCMFAIVGFMYCSWPGAASLAFWLFIAAAVGDWLDGHLARKRGVVSNFGKLMDALTDKIMVMGLVIAFVDQHVLPVALALITLCREFLITGLRMVVAAKGVVVPADRGGKSKTVTQLIALGFLLGAPMAGRDWSRLVSRDLTAFSESARSVGIAIFILGTVLAVWSGWRYVARYRSLIFGPND